MPKNAPPPPCPKCRKPMHFLLAKNGGRKFQCIDCVGFDPLKSPDVLHLFKSELQPPK